MESKQCLVLYRYSQYLYTNIWIILHKCNTTHTSTTISTEFKSESYTGLGSKMYVCIWMPMSYNCQYVQTYIYMYICVCMYLQTKLNEMFTKQMYSYKIVHH